MTTSSDIQARITRLGRYGATLSSTEVAGLDGEIDNLIRRIRGAVDLSAATADMDELGKMQDLMALLLFKYDAPLSPKQKAVVRRYDRYDDLSIFAEPCIRTLELAAFRSRAARRFAGAGQTGYEGKRVLTPFLPADRQSEVLESAGRLPVATGASPWKGTHQFLVEPHRGD